MAEIGVLQKLPILPNCLSRLFQLIGAIIIFKGASSTERRILKANCAHVPAGVATIKKLCDSLDALLVLGRLKIFRFDGSSNDLRGSDSARVFVLATRR